jgi:acetyl-CoA carboxylase biotin carboxylase subunit
LPQKALQSLCEMSSAMTSGLQYKGVGTLEFLYQNGEFYFIEMNTRIQVEHTVTESVTGIDLMRLQIEIAATGFLGIKQENVSIAGHAFECRINAEDENFNPGPGQVSDLRFPGGPGIRVDSHIYDGYEIPHHYDSLMAKLISYDGSRQEALKRMQRALAEFSVKGVASNIDLHRRIFNHPQLLEGIIDTGFLQKHILSE